jgi:hypothetical protein
VAGAPLRESGNKIQQRDDPVPRRFYPKDLERCAGQLDNYLQLLKTVAYRDVSAVSVDVLHGKEKLGRAASTRIGTLSLPRGSVRR